MKSGAANTQDLVYNKIMSFINSGTGLYYNRLPSEKQLAAKLQVSRGTVRAVLSRLESEGKIRKKHGSGTYVHPLYSKMRSTLYPKIEYSEIVKLNGYNCCAECSKIEIVQSEDVAAQLELPPDASFVKPCFVYYADGTPCIYCENYFDMNTFSPECIKALEKNPRVPFFDIVERWFGERPKWSACRLDTEDGQKFMNLRYTGKTIPPPSHCLVLHNIAYGTGDTPLYYAQTFCDTRILNLYVVQNTYSFAEK